MRQLLLQNATVILLQSATEVFCKMCQVLGHLLQNATVITKCNVNYKLRQYIYITKAMAVMKRSIFINKPHKHQKIDKT